MASATGVVSRIRLGCPFPFGLGRRRFGPNFDGVFVVAARRERARRVASQMTIEVVRWRGALQVGGQRADFDILLAEHLNGACRKSSIFPAPPAKPHSIKNGWARSAFQVRGRVEPGTECLGPIPRGRSGPVPPAGRRTQQGTRLAQCFFPSHGPLKLRWGRHCS